ncbi:hypothetical protein, partial [Methanospirillum hungatei]|uniref:hypothetical protein n=1 Tax=Methanospirillum hungatei TaxID=2203 RepID=UPI0026F3594E
MKKVIRLKEFRNIRFIFILFIFLSLVLFGWGVSSAFEGKEEYVDFISGNVTYVSSPHYVSIPHIQPPPVHLTNPLNDESGIAPGVIIYGRIPKNGLNILIIDNVNNNQDIVFGLKKPQWPHPDFAILIPGGTSVRIKDIPDGSYEAYLATGSGWDSSKKVFLNDPAYYQITEPLSLETSGEETRAGNRITYKRMYMYSYHIQKLLNENSYLTPMDAGEFPKFTLFS